MSDKKLSRSERETIIRRAADENSWVISTADSTIIRKLTKMYGKGKGELLGYMCWVVPKACVSFRKQKKDAKSK